MCEECGLSGANVHLTQILQDETRVFHLCEDCARKRGISISINDEQTVQIESTESPSTETEKSCSHCGLKLSDFRTKGWLGCSQCYSSFEPEIDELLVQVHGSSIHKGKKYSKLSQEALNTDQIKKLRLKLAMAIRNEEFEQAAAIRDKIHHLKSTGV